MKAKVKPVEQMTQMAD